MTTLSLPGIGPVRLDKDAWLALEPVTPEQIRALTADQDTRSLTMTDGCGSPRFRAVVVIHGAPATVTGVVGVTR